MKPFTSSVVMGMLLAATALIVSSNTLSGADGSDKPSGTDDATKTVYEKYLPNGDLVTATRTKIQTNPDKPDAGYKVINTIYLTKKGAAEKTEIWTKENVVPKAAIILPIGGAPGTLIRDVISSGDKIFILFRGSWVCVVCVQHDDNVYKTLPTILVRKESQAFGETVNKGYLFEMGGNIHVLLEYDLGTQEMWRIEGDKATRLWRLGEDELETRRKEKQQKENAPESTTPNETPPPATQPDAGAAPDSGITPSGETAPPAENNAAPPASGGGNPSPSEGTAPADSAQPANPPAENPPAATPEQPKPIPLEPPRVTFKCVNHYDMTSKISLPTNMAMASCMDKDGNLYIALESRQTQDVTIPGGLTVITAKGGTYTYNAKSKPPLPTESAEHVWKDDAGILYVATSKGLALIDTKNTPDDQSDDTVTLYSMMGVSDITTNISADPASYSPALGADNAVYSWMDPESRDLLVCCGGPSTWRGGLTVLVYDKDKKAYTKSHTYRSINFVLDKSARKLAQKGVFDTTQCYDPDKKMMLGGKRIAKLDIGENQYCWRAFRDNDSGLIYLARRDTYDADAEAVPGFNGDGGLTIIDTKKTPDPSDDTVVAVYQTGTSPNLPATSVMDVRLDKATGDLYVATTDPLSTWPTRAGGLTIIHKDKTAVTYSDKGLFDTSQNVERTEIDKAKALFSSFVLGSLVDEDSGDIFVFEDQGIDVIHKDGFVSRVPLKIFKGLTQMPPNNILWAESAWIDGSGRLHVCTGDYGTLGYLTFEIAKYEPPKAP